MPFRIDFKVLLAFIVFFGITYLESLSLGGISFASLWKIPFILYFFVYTASRYGNIKSDLHFIKVMFLFCVLMLFHTNMMESIFPELVDVPKFLIIVSFFYFIIKKYSTRVIDIIKAFFWFSIILIWTNVPYLIGIIKPKVQKDYSVSFGDAMEANAGFSGPYLTIHSQSVFMACALLFIVFLLKNFKKQFKYSNPFIIATLMIGLYCLYLSFARTGWLLFTVGVFFIFIKQLTVRNILRSIPFVFVGVTFFAILFVNNESFRRKLLDQREYSSGNRADDVGSGRLLMAKSALLNWSESDFLTILKGYGLDKGKEKMQKRIGGAKLFSHNGFVDILQRNGLIGLFCFFIFLYYLFKFIKGTNNAFTPLAKGFYWGWIFVGSIQEFTIVYLNAYLAGVLAILYLVEKSKLPATAK